MNRFCLVLAMVALPAFPAFVQAAAPAAVLSAPALLDQVQSLIDSGKKRDALAVAKHAVAASPHSATAYVALGNAEHSLYNFDDALTADHAALKIDPSLPGAYAGECDNYVSMRRLPEAEHTCAKAKALGVNTAMFHMDVSAIAVGEGNEQRAIDEANRAVEMSPYSWSVYNWRCLMLARHGRIAEALDDCNRAISLDANQAEAYVVRARLEMSTGEYGSVQEDVARALSLDPNMRKLVYALAEEAYTAHAYMAAGAIMSMYIPATPADCRGYLLLARSDQHLGAKKPAIINAQRAIRAAKASGNIDAVNAAKALLAQLH